MIKWVFKVVLNKFCIKYKKKITIYAVNKKIISKQNYIKKILSYYFKLKYLNKKNISY
jgi:hypothetical protein